MLPGSCVLEIASSQDWRCGRERPVALRNAGTRIEKAGGALHGKHILARGSENSGKDDCVMTEKPQLPTERSRDVTGLRFGRLTAVSYSGVTGKGCRASWLCECDCGNKVVVAINNLINGTKSCGCLRKETIRAIAMTRWTGRCSHPLDGTYTAMLARCYNKNHQAYKNYGGRGITVCDEWRRPNGFAAFCKDMGDPPSESHTLDRIDNSSGYCKENCRWATGKQQHRNRRNNRMITAKGVTKCLEEWSEESGINPMTIFNRIRRGWGSERAIFATPQIQNR